MHKVGMRLIHIETAISNSSSKPKCHVIPNFLTIFYLSKKLQNTDSQFLQQTRSI